MAPQPDAAAGLSYQMLSSITDGNTGGIDTHSFSLADYVVIHQCEPPCIDCEFIKISNKEALKLCLREEKLRNEKYREKLNNVLKKYVRSLRQVEYLKTRIGTLTRQLMEERRQKEGDNNTDFAIIDSSIQLDEDLFEFSKKPKLEIILE